MIKNNPKKKKLIQIKEEILYHNVIKEKYYNSKLEKK